VTEVALSWSSCAPGGSVADFFERQFLAVPSRFQRFRNRFRVELGLGDWKP